LAVSIICPIFVLKLKINDMWSDGEKEFAGTQNVWIKRLGLLVLVIGLFPAFALKYWGQIEVLGKWVIIFAIASYVIYHIRGFLKSIFKSKS
jgi:hypothetical protein